MESKIKEKKITVHALQDQISGIIREVEKGGIYYKVQRYKQPAVALINLNDLFPLQSFICQSCQIYHQHHGKTNHQKSKSRS